jgi:hypothetical protein
MTKEQQRAILKLFNRSSDGAASYLQFRRRFTDFRDYAGGQWCGMFIGIERDGYTHT